MKTMTNRRRTGSRHPRRGSLFHYYMMYLFLSSVLLTTSGLCMHSILDADRRDEAESIVLRTLLSMEQMLRSDVQSDASFDVANEQLTIEQEPGTKIVWTIETNVITQQRFRTDDLYSSQRFVFPKGTQASFAVAPESSLIKMMIKEPSRTPGSEVSGPTDRERPSIEMLFRISSGRAQLTPAEKGDESA